MSQTHLYIPFLSSSGREYELEIEPTSCMRVHHVRRFVEDRRGGVAAEPTGWQWDDLMEMTRDLRITIVNWRTDFGN